MAGDMVVCAGYCEADGDRRYNSVVCVHDGRVLGNHRKVHQPLRENASYDSGDSFAAFDTPVGRLGLLICLRQGIPESARALALTAPRSSWWSRLGPASPHERVRTTSPTTAGPAASTSSIGPAPGEPGDLAVGEPVRHVRLAALRVQRQGGRPRWRRAGHHRTAPGMAVAAWT
jgi:hypothetical protein